jgi:uncharacterized integral membrane protein
MGDEHDPAQTPPAAPEPVAPSPGQAPAAEPVQAEPVQPAPPPPYPEHEARETFQPLLYAKILSLLFVVGYSIAFIVGNDTKIRIDFVFATANVSLIWTVLLLLAVGLVGGVLLSQLYRHRRRQQLAKKADAVADRGGRGEAEGKPGGASSSS